MLGIGPKLRDARMAQNLSLRDLGAKTDVSASLLSQIENNKANPSVRTLHSLADALALPIDYFFPDRAEESAASAAGEQLPAHAMTASELRQRQVNTEDGVAVFAQTESKAAAPILRRGQRPTIELQGDVTWARLTPDKEEKSEFLEICYAVGGASGDRMSHHSGREFVLVLVGELTLELGFDQYLLTVGDSAIFDSETPHRLSNRGTEPMRAMSVIFHQ